MARTIVETTITRDRGGELTTTLSAGGHNVHKAIRSCRQLRTVDPTVVTWTVRLMNMEDNSVLATYTMPEHEA